MPITKPARVRLPDGSFTDLNQVARWDGRGFASLQVENGQRLVLVTGELPETVSPRVHFKSNCKISGYLTSQEFGWILNCPVWRRMNASS